MREIALASVGRSGHFPAWANSAKVEQIIHEVEALSEEERDELMRALDPAEETEVSAEWMEEINRRAGEIDEGKVQLVTEADFRRKLRAT